MEESELRDALSSIEEDQKVLFQRWVSSSEPMDAATYHTLNDEAERREDALRRQLAELTGEQLAVRLDLGLRPEAAVSGALLVQTESRCFLLFNVSGPSVENRVPQAIVEFEGATTRFGWPNDEALPGHALYDKGLCAYEVLEILNSEWASEVERRNQIVFPNSRFNPRHFVVTFHDSTFECLATRFSVSRDERPFEEIWCDLQERVSRL